MKTLKSIYAISALLIAFCCFAPRLAAQTTAVDIPQPKQVIVEFANQPGSPVEMAVGKSPIAGMQVITIELSNTDPRHIRGYTLIVDTDGTKTSSINMKPEKPIEKGTPHRHLLNGQRAERNVTVSVDYVQFDDGSSWGADEIGGSIIITNFVEGRDLALKRLTAMLAETNINPAEILNSVRAFGGFGLGAPVKMRHDAARFRLEGYRTVIKGLRAPNKNVPENQELARRLELLETALER